MPGYPVSGASLPLRSVSFWPAILPPGYPVFGAPSPAPPRPFLTGYFDAQVSLFRYPRAFFSLPVLVSLVVFFDALLFSTQPSLPGYLGGRLALCAALRLACGFYRSAVFTAPRFLPLRGFYRSAVFTAPLSPVLWGGFALPPPSCLLPPVFPTSGRLALWATLRYACDFYRSAVFTAPRFLPLRGFSRPAIFTAPRFLPLCGFYRSAIFTAPRFLPLRFHRFFWGALLFHRPRTSCPPVFPHFRAAHSLCHLPVHLRFLPLRGFYRSVIFTAPRFLPLRGFYRSAVFTAPRFLPLRDFYRSAVFTAPRFFPLRFRRFFGGLCSSFLPPSLRPLPGAPCATGSSVASPVGHHSWSSFCATCLTALGALPLISPVSLLCISYTLGDHRSSRLLNDGTRAPRVLPPPSWDLSAIGN